MYPGLLHTVIHNCHLKVKILFQIFEREKERERNRYRKREREKQIQKEKPRKGEKEREKRPTCAHLPYMSMTANTLLGRLLAATPWETPFTKNIRSP